MEDYIFISKVPNIIWVSKNKIDERIDCNPYKISYIENAKILEENNDTCCVDDLLKNKKEMTGGSTPLGANYLDKGINFIRTQNVDRNYIDLTNIVYISEEDNKKLIRSELHKGDILLTITGADFGRIAPVMDFHLPANINQHSVRMHFKKNIDPFFVSTFLNSLYGQSQIFRYSIGATRPAIDYPSIRKIKVPTPSPEIQKHIGDKVRKAETLREEATRLKKEAEHMLSEEILQFNYKEESSKNVRWIMQEELLAQRLEPEFYKSEYIAAEKSIRKQRHKSLGSIILEIQDGPGGWSISTNDYINFGIPIIRGINIGEDGQFVNKGFVYISENKNKELKKTQVTPGQVLLTVRGTIGRATVMPEYLKMANLNAAVVRLKVKEDIIDPYYLAGFLNSYVGRLQTSKISNGAVQQNMNLTECKSNLIPIPEMSLQKKYREKFIRYLEYKNQFINLINEAKQDVEDLIEGNFNMNKLTETTTESR